MKRFIQKAELKPEKLEEYKKLHAKVWPDVLKTISECNLSNYTISVIGTTAISYFEYNGDNYDADIAKMENDPVTQRWWKYTKPCFKGHEDGVYYVDCEEIFHFQ